MKVGRIKRHPCNKENCERPRYARGLCLYHDKIENPHKHGSKRVTPRKKKKKPKRKTIAQLKRLAREHFQRWIRITKVGDGVTCCYGCGTWIDDYKKCDGCHFLKAECYSEAVFDPDNVWPGCKRCNKLDPLIEYRKFLITTQGKGFVETLETKYKRSKGSYKWDREFLEKIIEKYKALNKSLTNSTNSTISTNPTNKV